MSTCLFPIAPCPGKRKVHCPCTWCGANARGVCIRTTLHAPVRVYDVAGVNGAEEIGMPPRKTFPSWWGNAATLANKFWERRLSFEGNMRLKELLCVKCVARYALLLTVHGVGLPCRRYCCTCFEHNPTRSAQHGAKRVALALPA